MFEDDVVFGDPRGLADEPTAVIPLEVQPAKRALIDAAVASQRGGRRSTTAEAFVFGAALRQAECA